MINKSEELCILIDNAFAYFENILLNIRDNKFKDGTHKSKEQKEIIQKLIYTILGKIIETKNEIRNLNKEELQMSNMIPFNIMPAELLVNNLNCLYEKNIKPVFSEILDPEYCSCTYKLSKNQKEIVKELNKKILNEINITNSELETLEIKENEFKFSKENILELFEKINDEYCEYFDIEKWSKLNEEINNIYEKNKDENEKEDDEYYEL